MKHQIIEHNGKPAYVLVPIEDYESHLTDEALFDKAMAENDGKYYPGELVEKLIVGDNPVRLFREHEDMTQEELANACGLTKNFISMLETGRRKLTNKTATKIAKALDVDVDILKND